MEGSFTETNGSETDIPTSANVTLKGRNKSSLRVRYDAESKIIRTKLGGLENVRNDLGLSQRKMSQLLLVDPSAWSRWVKDEDLVPPHIWKSLQWYMSLIDKNPIWHPQNSAYGVNNLEVHDEKINKMQKDLEYQISYLKKENNRLEDLFQQTINENSDLQNKISNIKGTEIEMGWKLVVLVNILSLIWLMFYLFT